MTRSTRLAPKTMCRKSRRPAREERRRPVPLTRAPPERPVFPHVRARGTHPYWSVFVASCISLTTAATNAHGVVGARFFPATIATDDPFAADELALPTITAITRDTGYDLDYSKTLFPGFAISLGAGYADERAGPHASGFTKVTVTPSLEMWRNEVHETIVTAACIWEIGGTGSRAVADRDSSYTPEILFGKGLGDLPDSMTVLRPLAVTGQLGFSFPGTGHSARVFQWGGAVEYSLLYLQNNVNDIDLSAAAARLTPIVEYTLSTPTDAGGGGTTGTINPGILWSGQYIQLGVEAIVPANRASGDSIGLLAQLHFYVDDISPDAFGRPLFESPG